MSSSRTQEVGGVILLKRESVCWGRVEVGRHAEMHKDSGAHAGGRRVVCWHVCGPQDKACGPQDMGSVSSPPIRLLNLQQHN